MANIYPNNNAALFGAWILANSNIRVTPARKIQIQTIITQAQTGGYVAQLYYSEFIAYTNQWYAQYQQYLTQQPNVPQPETYDALTTAWLAVVSSPSQQTIYSVDAFFKQLRADGNLLLDYFFLFAQDNQANARIDLINPTLYAVTEHNTPTWNANQGYTGNGSTMYLSANFIDSVDGVNYQQNNALFGCYLRQAVVAGSHFEMGSGSGTIYAAMAARNAAGQWVTDINDNGGINPSNTQTQGLFANQRTSSSNIIQTLNGIQFATGSASSTGRSTINDYMLAANFAGSPAEFSINQMACAFKGSGSINQETFNSAVNLLMTNLGAHY